MNINLNIPQELFEKAQKNFNSEKELLNHFSEIIENEVEYLVDINYVMDLDLESE
ncbi:MAG: hypothetical protein AD073_000025 [Mycoplasmataceae bacterium]|nr:MAG: hypothetical protein AD073_000025 [Mycoplasmataceae bacterium]